MISPSFNELAEAKKLPAWSSWKLGRPSGYFSLPFPEQADGFYRDNGFFVFEGACSMEQVEELRNEALAICKEERGKVHGVETYDPSLTDDEVMRKYLCIHFPHKVSEIMAGYLSHPEIVEPLTRVISPNVKCMQSMLFIKAAGKPGQAWHQDEIYIPTRDRSLTGAWIALDDATVENGCLWVIPGSHRRGILWEMKEHDGRRFDCSGQSEFFGFTNDDAVPVEVKAGSIVFFNGHLLHRSLPNYASSGYRRCLVNHYMSAESFLPWYGDLPKGMHGATADYRDIVMVAGEDPYAYKGIENLAGAHVRPSGEGGCGSQKRNEEAVDNED